jgi:hypothetical protein
MQAFTFSSRLSWLLLAALTAVVVVITATRSSPSLEPRVEVAIPEDQLASPRTLGTCNVWPNDFGLRDAMQTCSTWARLETNERWLFGVRATIENHRVVDVLITYIDYDCDACFDDEADGRAERARYTVSAVQTCMREQLASATFEDDRDSCTLDTRWSIQNDW